jgi:hypothetical protein
MPGKCTFPFQKEFRSSKSRAEHNEARIRPKNEQILGGQFLDPARMQMTARGEARGRVSGFWLFQGMYPISRWGSQRNNRDATRWAEMGRIGPMGHMSIWDPMPPFSRVLSPIPIRPIGPIRPISSHLSRLVRG